MNFSEFQECIEKYGTRFDLWPSGLREQAAPFMSAHDDARALYDEASAFDSLFKKFDPALFTDPESEKRVMERVESLISTAGFPKRPAERIQSGWLQAINAIIGFPTLALPMGLSVAAGLTVGFFLPPSAVNVSGWGPLSPLFNTFAMLGY